MQTHVDPGELETYRELVETYRSGVFHSSRVDEGLYNVDTADFVESVETYVEAGQVEPFEAVCDINALLDREDELAAEHVDGLLDAVEHAYDVYRADQRGEGVQGYADHAARQERIGNWFKAGSVLTLGVQPFFLHEALTGSLDTDDVLNWLKASWSAAVLGGGFFAWWNTRGYVEDEFERVKERLEQEKSFSHRHAP